MDHRLRGIAGEEWKPWTAPNAAYNVRLHPERLTAPLHWRKPRRVFVNSMSDLFHEQVPDEFIDRVFAVMALTPQHTYQVLTKRPERMREYLTSPRHGEPVETFVELEKDRISTEAWGLGQFLGAWPLPNVWLGVSCEDQRRADERIPLLLQTPAAVRFISAEPLLGPIDLRTGSNRPARAPAGAPTAG
jgi:protein gp37